MWFAVRTGIAAGVAILGIYLLAGIVVVGWTAIGIGQGIPPIAFFGRTYYAVALSPVYLLLYLVFGVVEHRTHG